MSTTDVAPRPREQSGSKEAYLRPRCTMCFSGVTVTSSVGCIAGYRECILRCRPSTRSTSHPTHSYILNNIYRAIENVRNKFFITIRSRKYACSVCSSSWITCCRLRSLLSSFASFFLGTVSSHVASSPSCFRIHTQPGPGREGSSGHRAKDARKDQAAASVGELHEAKGRKRASFRHVCPGDVRSTTQRNQRNAD